MSEKLIAVTTQIGKQKAFDAGQEQIKVKITHIAVGDGAYVPNENQTALQSEKDRIPILSSKIDPENFLINFGAIINNDKSYWVNEIGFYLEDGTLFSVWSHPTIRLGEKTPINKFLFGYSLQLVDVGLDKIEVIDAGIDLTLNYSEEFLTMGLSITRLSNVVLNLSEKVRSAVNSCDKITKEAISQMQTVQNDTLVEMKKVLDDFNQVKEEFSLESFKKSVIDWQTFEYVSEYIRQEKNTGIMGVNQTREALGEPYKQPLDIRYSPLNAHNHPNYQAMPGSGQYEVNANGVIFQTRHNDYRLYRPKADGGFLEVEPNTPEPLVLDGTVAEQTEQVKSLYNRFFSGELIEEEKKYFRYSLSYMEVWYEIVDNIDSMIDDGFDSFRHGFGRNSPIALAQKAVEFRTTGKKSRFENYPYLPVCAKIDKDGIERYVVVKYRISSIPIPKWDGKQWEEVMNEKEDIISEARFGEIDIFDGSKKFAIKDIDSILHDIPGLGGYSENITKKTPDGYTITSPENGARYHRNYTISTDATGRANYTNGWNDPALILSYTDNKKVFGEVSTFVPLEVTLSTPVQSWNPYGFVDGTVAGDGSEANPYTTTNPNGRWYQTPAELYTGFDQVDPADTGRGAKWVLDANKEKHLVVPSGVWIVLPELKDVDERIRMRYPVYYTAHEYSPANIALSAARKQMLSVGVANAKAMDFLKKKLLDGAGHLSTEEIEEVLEALKNADSDLRTDLKEQREALLLPIVSNALGITRIINILISNKEKK